MKVETKFFLYPLPFFLLAGTVYGFMVHWHEPVGYLGIWFVGLLVAMVGGYLWFTGNRLGDRPEDRSDGEIHEGSGEQGFFSPWSWWPLALGIASGLLFLGLAVGWWIVWIAVGFGIVALVGWVFEYSRGDHAH